MKKLVLASVSSLLFFFAGYAYAGFVSGSTGADGAFNPSTTIEVVLPADGVLNYTTVNIPSGVTVTFKKNAANTPVYMLATGDVTIAGTVKLDGASTTTATLTSPGAGGPGGYDGGYGGTTGNPGGSGIGPGGGGGGPSSSYFIGGGGGFGTAGGSQGGNYGAGGSAYGNASLVPLIGGSGGGGKAGSAATSGYGGGGGGGAILIASSGTITVTGSITANGGNGYSSQSGGGSGGAVRLIANTISGTGAVQARGGNLGSNSKGGEGRIRLEAFVNNFIPATDPVYTYDNPGSVFVANIPVLTITSVAGVSAPANPAGSYSQPDIMLPSATTNPVTVNLSASNIPVSTTVTVRVTPQFGSSTDVTAALSGTDASSTASASVNLSTQYSNVITASATFTLLVAMNYDGEAIKMARVETTMGRGSEVTYITETGREIKLTELMVKLMER